MSSSLVTQWEKPSCGAETNIELGPALQHADTLPTEPRRTYFTVSDESHCYVAPPLDGMQISHSIFIFYVQDGEFSSTEHTPNILSRVHTTNALYRKFEASISRNETARPRSQFLHSCICERFIYFHGRSANAVQQNRWTESW
jgi:hypothetical protein